MPRLLLALPFAWIGVCAREALPELTFNAPAKSFHESCLIGNGRLGATAWDSLENERAVLNEQTQWSASAPVLSCDCRTCAAEAKKAAQGQLVHLHNPGACRKLHKIQDQIASSYREQRLRPRHDHRAE
ncbi:MAG TPA: hypothetical protein DCY41_00285 [Opitutae bacterium]|nr:hypothetical protein [Opitutae bacterium]